jgi:aerobic carbon-monoxide dehydrogenase large subunit
LPTSSAPGSRTFKILQGDSAVVAHGTGSYASRSAVLAGGAATLTARLLKEKVIRAASHLLEAAVDDIEAADGRVFVSGTDRSVTFREIARAVYSEIGRLPREARDLPPRSSSATANGFAGSERSSS